MDFQDYAAGDFVIPVHKVTADESPLEIDTTGGYVTVNEGTAITPVGRGRFDVLPEPWFSETFTEVPAEDDGPDFSTVEQTDEHE